MSVLSGTNMETGKGWQPVRVGLVVDSFETVIAQQNKQTGNNRPNCRVVEYSPKSVAVFGETRAIKNELKAMGGRFNSRLTFDGQRVVGWVFFLCKILHKGNCTKPPVVSLPTYVLV